MSCQIVQVQPPSNRGEKAMFDFLKYLPPAYTLYSELRINAAYNRQVEGLEEKKPDFVVVAEDVGVVSIEVKDWNLDRSTYEWISQYKVRKVDKVTGKTVAELDSPGAQVSAYLHGLRNLLGEDRHVSKPWVTSLLAVPLLTRHEFISNTNNSDKLIQKTQSAFILDLEMVMFRDDLDRHADRPDELLKERVRQGAAKNKRQFQKPSGRAIFKTKEVLIPSKIKVGGDAALQEARQHIHTLTEQQQQWAFSLDSSANYLLDVAGSGKTNALISRALHVVDSTAGPAPAILITTYNRNLEKGLQRVFKDKVGEAASSTYQSIQILSVPALLEAVVDAGYGENTAQGFQNQEATPEAYERRLLREAREVLRADADRFARFDHVFIDEIQDFSDAFLRIVTSFSKGDRYFFVGDVGQKIYDREHDLQRHGITTRRLGMEPSYQMYRTPKYIAELATSFAMADEAMKREFTQQGYSENFAFPNPIENGAVMRREPEQEAAAAALLQELLTSAYPGGEGKMLVVTSAGRLDACEQALAKAGVRCRIGEAEAADAVTIVEFSDAKGLEREVVVVLGIEDLYVRGQASGVFDEVSERIARESRNRRKLYVALTRSMERLYVLYSDRSHSFVQELCNLNDRIGRARTRG